MRILYSLFLSLIVLQAKAQCTATITAMGPTTFCAPDSVVLVANPGGTYQWFLNGSAISGATSDTLVVNASGSYEVEIDSAGCISMSAPENITVNTVPPQPGVITGPDTACVSALQTYSVAPVPGALKYLWVGISLSQMGGGDTTLVPAITGYAMPGFQGAPGSISVAAINSCGAGQYSEINPKTVGPPQIDGHWPYDRDVADMLIRVCPGTQYTLFPVLHAYLGTIPTDKVDYQWYLDNTAIAGATEREYVINRGGNYSVKILTHHCGTFTIPKKVYQDVPNSITISPGGPLSFCTGNVTPLTVSFDMTGVSDPINWSWWKGSYTNQETNVYSVLPDTSGYYMVMSKWGYPSNCMIQSNAVFVTVPPALDIIQVDDTLFATPGYNNYQWFENNQAVPGATSQSYVLTYDGIYSVEATFMNGCLETSDTFDSDYILPPPGNNNNNNNNNQVVAKSVSVYPNPAVGPFTIQAIVNVLDKEANISITDLTGKTLYTATAEVKDGVVEHKVDLGDDIARFCIVKVRSKRTNKTALFYIRN